MQIDTTTPKEKWEFDKDVTEVFDNMLERSIPQYEIMRKACFDLGCKFIQQHSHIVDLGCSRGEALSPFIEKYQTNNRYYGIEISQPMLEASRLRFSKEIKEGLVFINELDLRNHYPPIIASLTLAVLTVQFISIEYRQRLIQCIYDTTIPKGAFIFVEKVLGNTANIDKEMVDIYYQLKASNGYSQEQIERKRLSLEGVLVPVTAKWDEELLRMAGFKEIDCFWRWINFAGWIAIK